MKRNLTALSLTVALLACGGCMSQNKYDALEHAWRTSQEQVAARDARIAELEQQIKLLQAQADKNAEILAEVKGERDKLAALMGDWQRKFEGLEGRLGIALPAALNEELRRFAEEHPDLVEYDAERGMVKFRADLTFALGSADLQPKAAATLRQLANILNGPEASKYEVRIVGHTDSVAIRKADTMAKHPTNWHLSVHRSISVRDALDGAGVAAVRTSVAGYSKYRPVAPNARAGSESNRRVELYLVPMAPVNESFLDGGEAAAPARAPANETEPAQPE